MHKVHIIGIGPGAQEYLLPIARQEIERADCLIGAKRVLALFRNLDKEKVCLDGHFEKVIPYIEENRDKKKLAILVSGDPGLYSLSARILQFLKKGEYVIIPGISTMQFAFAKIGEIWEGAKVISIHGREHGNLAEEVKSSAKIFLFTDSKFSPEKIAAYLLEKGVENRRAVVLENLSYPDERIVDVDLKDLSNMSNFGLCVMVVLK